MEGYLTINEFAAMHNKPVRTIREWIKKGRLKAHRPGGGVRGQLFIPNGAFTEMMRKSQVGGIS